MSNLKSEQEKEVFCVSNKKYLPTISSLKYAVMWPVPQHPRHVMLDV